jgi:peptidoglycan/xylan/chitin deacetylase (PgdA/CDA1 family)
MVKGRVTISIDLELAWGTWDVLTPEHLRLAEALERPICAALIELFDRYEVAATWAIVAGLLDASCSTARPGNKACWYAPDIIERVTQAKVGHEIGSHSGQHIYFDRATASQAQEDLEFAQHLHQVNGLSFKSFIFPRNSVDHLNILAKVGLQTFRGPGVDWIETARRAGKTAGQVANLVDKLLPIAPAAVVARECGELTDVPPSMLLIGRNGLRRFAWPQVTRLKLRKGLERAKQAGRIFHLWFHPSNFYYRREEQLATLKWFLELISEEAGRGAIEILTMGSIAAARRPVPAASFGR